ncbi:hypothetical protein EniyanLRS_164 [Mycobacterium phage EniyanLRS]|uniref:Uncharacterized protein n=1 Tax=Mycobacterium phage EniyanLRS TaxID=1933770 RepID=A0A6B9M430_9CAUD|nr:hypothetical protein EniyanLRS_164 [Mycobacterium phage EniyanLRS]
MRHEKFMRVLMEVIWFATKTLAVTFILLLAIALIGG